MEKKSLFQINNEYLSIIENSVDPETGEITAEGYAALQLNIKDAQIKASGYIAIIKKFEADAEIMKQYKEQAELLQKRAEKKIEYLKKTLLAAVENFGEIHTDLYKLSVRKSESINIIDEELIPLEFIVLKKQPDKAKIKKSFNDLRPVAGCELVEKNNLSIK